MDYAKEGESESVVRSGHLSSFVDGDVIFGVPRVGGTLGQLQPPSGEHLQRVLWSVDVFKLFIRNIQRIQKHTKCPTGGQPGVIYITINIIEYLYNIYHNNI